MLYLSAAERQQLQRRIDTVMDVSAAHADGKASTAWIATLTKAKNKL